MSQFTGTFLVTLNTVTRKWIHVLWYHGWYCNVLSLLQHWNHSHTPIACVCTWHGNKSLWREAEAAFGLGRRHVNVVRIIRAGSLPQPQNHTDIYWLIQGSPHYVARGRRQRGNLARKKEWEDLREKRKNKNERCRTILQDRKATALPLRIFLYIKCPCLLYTACSKWIFVSGFEIIQEKKKRAGLAVTSLVFSSFLPLSFHQYLVPSCLIEMSHSLLFFYRKKWQFFRFSGWSRTWIRFIF